MIFDDAIAEVHHRRAHLHVAAAEQEELRCVAPGADAADAGGREHAFGVTLHLLHHVESDGFDGGPAVSAMRAFAVDHRPRLKGVEVDASDGVDGVDGRERVCTCTFRGARGDADVGDVGRELDDHGCASFFFDPRCDALGVFGHLSDGRAHAALAHSVRATEVELETIGAGILDLRHDLVPGCALGADHERRDDDVLWIASLDLGDFAQIDDGGPVGDELDVVEAHHALPFQSIDE